MDVLSSKLGDLQYTKNQFIKLKLFQERIELNGLLFFYQFSCRSSKLKEEGAK